MGKSVVQYFNIRELGATLYEVAVETIDVGHQSLRHHCYHSSLDADLLLWIDQSNNIIKQQAIIYGQIVEWNLVEGLRTGFILEDDSTKEDICYDREVQNTSFIQAIEFVDHMECIDEELKNRIYKNFIEAPVMKSMSDQEFIVRYGSHYHKRGRENSSVLPVLRKIFQNILKK